jgi:hypothetical protein
MAFGGPVLKREVTVEPNPRWKIPEADRTARQRAIMSAYTLQQQLVPARDAAQRVAEQVAAMRQYLSAAGEGGHGALVAAEKVSQQIGQVQMLVNRALGGANQAQGAMDGFDGLPTAAQLKQLDWAWEDALAGVAALNRVIQQDMPSLYASMGGVVRWPEVKVVGVPAQEP